MTHAHLAYIYIYTYIVATRFEVMTGWLGVISIYTHQSCDLRTVLLLMLVTAWNGTWCLEQPGSSCLEFYPLFRDFLTAMYEANFQDDAVSYTCDLIKHFDNQLQIIVNIMWST